MPTSLPAGHPHAWDVTHADQYLPAVMRRKMPTGGRLVVTDKMKLLAAGMPSALDRGAAIALSGPVGAGKTTHLHAVAAVADVNTAFVVLPSKATEAAQWGEIVRALTGTIPEGTARSLQNQAREYLTAVPTLLIVDEAQYLSRAALLQLRWLWDQPFPKFAIILAGSNLADHLRKEESVWSRIDRPLNLTNLDRAAITAGVRKLHPCAAETDEHVLHFIDDVYAHGSWRAWSKVLLTISNDWKHTGPVTTTLAQDAIEAVSGIRPAASTPFPRNHQMPQGGRA